MIICYITLSESISHLEIDLVQILEKQEQKATVVHLLAELGQGNITLLFTLPPYFNSKEFAICCSCKHFSLWTYEHLFVLLHSVKEVEFNIGYILRLEVRIVLGAHVRLCMLENDFA